MSNPFEYREVMKASMRFNETRTVEEVLAEHEKRHDERASERSASRVKGGRKRSAPAVRTPTAKHLNALEALEARARALREAKEA